MYKTLITLAIIVALAYILKPCANRIVLKEMQSKVRKEKRNSSSFSEKMSWSQSRLRLPLGGVAADNYRLQDYYTAIYKGWFAPHHLATVRQQWKKEICDQTL